MTTTVTIEMPAELSEELGRVADEQGTTPESLIVQTLRERFTPGDEPAAAQDGGGTLADLLAEHIGVLDSGELVPGGARMSERRSEYAKMLMRDHREGRR